MRAREAADFFYKVKEGKGTTSSELPRSSEVNLRYDFVGAPRRSALYFLRRERMRASSDNGSQSPGFEHVYTSTCEPPI